VSCESSREATLGGVRDHAPQIRPGTDRHRSGIVLRSVNHPARGCGELLSRKYGPGVDVYICELSADGEDDLDEGDDPDRWLWVNSEGSRPGYRDMELFIDGLDDADAADRLSIAISGRGAFRRFKDVLTRWPDLFDRWSSFSEDRRRGRARTWLAAAGYTACE